MEWNLFNVIWVGFWIAVISMLSQSIALEKAKQEEMIDFKQKLIIALVCVLFFIWFFFGMIPVFGIDGY